MSAIPILITLAAGGIIGFMVALALSRGKAAGALAQLDALRADFAKADQERVVLRTEAARRLEGEAAARQKAAGLEMRVAELQQEAASERAAANQAATLKNEAENKLGRLETQLQEREKSLVELGQSVEKSKQQLTDLFKATGAEILNGTAEKLLQRAKEQFESQRDLSQQELKAREQAVESLVAPLKEQLQKQEKLVQELGEKREGDAKSLAQQLTQIADLQQKASNAALTLSSAMRDNRQRGQWGEVTLRNVVEMAGLGAHVDFVEQSSLESDGGARLRPDMIVRLPGGRSIPIDAKVPMSAYLDSINVQIADDDRLRKRESHAGAVRSHVRTLTSRDYASAVEGQVELTVMFVPVESALAAALETDGTLFKEALDQRVIITTPSTLLALLRTCALQWQQSKLNENARRIGGHAKELLVRIQNVADDLQKVGRNLDQATKAFNEAVGSYNRRLVPKARDTAELAGELEAAPAELDVQSRLARTDIVGGQN